MGQSNNARRKHYAIPIDRPVTGLRVRLTVHTGSGLKQAGRIIEELIHTPGKPPLAHVAWDDGRATCVTIGRLQLTGESRIDAVLRSAGMTGGAKATLIISELRKYGYSDAQSEGVADALHKFASVLSDGEAFQIQVPIIEEK